MDWIRTDIDLGLRIKGFELPYDNDVVHMQLGRSRFDIKVLQSFFEVLQLKGLILQTAALVRIGMPPNKMTIIFYCQDSSFPVMLSGAEIPIEQIKFKQELEG